MSGSTLEGSVVLVVGASRGIGAGVARAFAQAGASVALAARDESALEATAAEIEAAGGTAVAFPTDITDAAAVAKLTDRVLARFGRLDAACNNAAGGGHPPTPLADVPLEAFEAAWAVNVRGTFLAMQHELKAMLETGGGAIVNIGSTASLEAVGGLAAYTATKHAIAGLTKVAALDYADRGVRVNALAPGPVLTDALEHAGEQAIEQTARSIPLGRVGQVPEIASAAVWLCSPAASFVTGTILTADGGKLAGQQPFMPASKGRHGDA